MKTFGVCSGGGRRQEKRECAPLVARLETLSRSYDAVLVDISATGARLQGAELPRRDEDIYFSIEGIRTVGSVKWRREMECGLRLYEPLLQSQVVKVRKEVADGAGLPPEMRAALNDWVLGMAR